MGSTHCLKAGWLTSLMDRESRMEKYFSSYTLKLKPQRMEKSDKWGLRYTQTHKPGIQPTEPGHRNKGDLVWTSLWRHIHTNSKLLRWLANSVILLPISGVLRFIINKKIVISLYYFSNGGFFLKVSVKNGKGLLHYNA